MKCLSTSFRAEM